MFTQNQLSIDHQAVAREQLSSLSRAELDQDWKLESFFGSIHVINLPDARSRLELVSKQLHDIGVKHFEVFSAVDGRKDVEEVIWRKLGEKSATKDRLTAELQKKLERKLQGKAGCYLSHMRLIEKVREKYKQALLSLEQAQSCQDPKKIEAAIAEVKKYCSVLILEDDNGFGIVGLDRQSVTRHTVGTLFREAMAELPADWDMIYFMSYPFSRSEVATPHLARLKNAYALNAFAVSHRMYDALYNRIKKITDPMTEKVAPIDVEYAHFQKTARCYGVVPSIAFQNEGLSYITSVHANHIRQIQSYLDDQAEQFRNSYSSLLLHPFSAPADKDVRFQFVEESCPLKTLRSRFQELEKNESIGLKLERRKITARLTEFLERKTVEGKRHSFAANLCIKRMPGRSNSETLNANDIELGQNRYILHATPETPAELGALFDAALQKGATVFVSVLQSTDAQERVNNFWEKKTLAEITTKDGWTITQTARTPLYASDPLNLIESRLEARSTNGEVRTLTHLHLHGWEQDTSMRDRAPFHLLLDRIEELHVKPSPLVIHSKWGVGRSGVVAILHFLRQEIDAQLARNVSLDNVTINIAKAIFDLRKQRNGSLEHDPLIRDVYTLLIEHYENLKQRQELVQAFVTPHTSAAPVLSYAH